MLCYLKLVNHSDLKAEMLVQRKMDLDYKNHSRDLWLSALLLVLLQLKHRRDQILFFI